MSTGLEPRHRTEGFDLEHVRVGVRLGIAAHVGVLCARDIRIVLDQHFAVEHVGGPALGVEHAGLLLGRRLRVLPQLDVLAAPRPARIAHVGEVPQHERTRRNEHIRVRDVDLLRVDGRSALRHDRQRPGREFDGPGVAVDEAVRNLDAVGSRRQADPRLLVEAVTRLGVAQDHGCAVDLVIYGDVVRGVRARHDFGRVPEAMAAVVVPLGIAGLAESGLVVVKEILAADIAEPDNARPDIGGHDQLHLSIGEPDAVRPAAEFNGFNHLWSSSIGLAIACRGRFRAGKSDGSVSAAIVRSSEVFFGPGCVSHLRTTRDATQAVGLTARAGPEAMLVTSPIDSRSRSSSFASPRLKSRTMAPWRITRIR